MLRLIAFILVLTAGVVAAAYSRFAALLLYLWFAMFRPQEWLWVDITNLRLSVVLGALLVVPSVLTGVFPNVTHPLSIGSLAFFACGLIAQAGAISPDAGWHWLGYLAKLLLVSLLTVTIVSDRRRMVLTVAVLSGSLAFFFAKAGVYSILRGGVRFGAGLAGAFVDNNGYAMAVAMMLPMLFVTARNLPDDTEVQRWIRRGYLVAIPLGVVTVIGTFSRGGILALAGVLLAHILVQRRRLKALVIVTAVAAAVAAFVPLPEGYGERVQTIEGAADDSVASRLHFWRVALDMSADNPLGVGFGGYEPAYDRYDFLHGRYGRRRSVHSSHFQVLAEAGMPGFAVWVALFGTAFWTAFKIRRRSRHPALARDDAGFLFTTANGLIVSMVGFLIGGAFIALALNDLTWLTFGLIAALDRISVHMIAEAKGAGLPATAVPARLPPVWAVH